jgi:hypothetical protein
MPSPKPKPAPDPPWYRLEGEGPQAYAAFRCYLELGAERSLDRVGRNLYPTRRRPGRRRRKRGKTGRLEAWSKRWRWVERALAYTDHRMQQEWRALEAEHERSTAEIAGLLSGSGLGRIP